MRFLFISLVLFGWNSVASNELFVSYVADGFLNITKVVDSEWEARPYDYHFIFSSNDYQPVFKLDNGKKAEGSIVAFSGDMPNSITIRNGDKTDVSGFLLGLRSTIEKANESVRQVNLSNLTGLVFINEALKTTDPELKHEIVKALRRAMGLPKNASADDVLRAAVEAASTRMPARPGSFKRFFDGDPLKELRDECQRRVIGV